MTKNQINYLLALATLVVVWLYFNTFFGGAMAQKKAAGLGRMPTAVLDAGASSFPRSYLNRTSRSTPPTLEEMKNLFEARKAAAAGLANTKDVKAPVPVAPEKK